MKLLALALVGCSSRAPIETCNDSLAGSWAAPSGTWSIVDNGPTLEIYPLFPDAVGNASPRVIDIVRGADGNVTRRYTRGSRECSGRAPAHLVACHGETIDLVFADPTEPLFLDAGTCGASAHASSRKETWTRL